MRTVFTTLNAWCHSRSFENLGLDVRTAKSQFIQFLWSMVEITYILLSWLIKSNLLFHYCCWIRTNCDDENQILLAQGMPCLDATKKLATFVLDRSLSYLSLSFWPPCWIFATYSLQHMWHEPNEMPGLRAAAAPTSIDRSIDWSVDLSFHRLSELSFARQRTIIFFERFRSMKFFGCWNSIVPFLWKRGVQVLCLWLMKC